MAQIMEGQAFDTGCLTDPLEGLGDRIGAHIVDGMDASLPSGIGD